MNRDISMKRVDEKSSNVEAVARTWVYTSDDLSGEPDGELDELIREASKKPLTVEDIRAQRVSFAVGMMSSRNKMSREEIEKLAKRIYG